MSGWVGLYECTCRIFGSNSLKEKRRVLKSVLTKIRNRFNLSVAEVDYQDDWQLAKIALVGVGSSKKLVEQELRRASYLLESTGELEIIDAQITFV